MGEKLYNYRDIEIDEKFQHHVQKLLQDKINRRLYEENFDNESFEKENDAVKFIKSCRGFNFRKKENIPKIEDEKFYREFVVDAAVPIKDGGVLVEKIFSVTILADFMSPNPFSLASETSFSGDFSDPTMYIYCRSS